MIEIKNLYKEYNSEPILKDINLEFKDGEFVILKGISGSGKSTLLSIIAGLDKPTSGAVFVDKEPISKLPDLHLSHFRAKRIGIVFQHFNLIEYLTVEQNLLVPLIVGSNNKENIAKALEFANIKHKAKESVNNLSGGEKQRVAIARAIVNNPNTILFDEPTANLDHKNSLKFIELLRKLKSENRSIVIATHDTIFDNLDLVDKVVNIKDGIVYE